MTAEYCVCNVISINLSHVSCHRCHQCFHGPTLVEFLPVRNHGKVMVPVFIIEALGVCLADGLTWRLIPMFDQKACWYLIIATSIPNFWMLRIAWYFACVFENMAHLKKYPALLILNKLMKLILKRRHCFNNPFLPFYQCLIPLCGTTFHFAEQHICIIFVTKNASSIFLLSVLKDLGNNPCFTAFIGYLGQIPGILLMHVYSYRLALCWTS